MITRNGLNLFKTLLSRSQTDIDKMTDNNNRASNLMIHSEPTVTQLYNGSLTPINATFDNKTSLQASNFIRCEREAQFGYYARTYSDGMTHTKYETATQSQALRTSSFYSLASVYYKAPEEYVFTIAPNQGDVSTKLAPIFTINSEYYSAGMFAPRTATTNMLTSCRGIAPYGIAGADTNYLTLTLPAAFHSAARRTLSADNFLGAQGGLLFNLGYSSDTESIDDYELSSPVYNKRLWVNYASIIPTVDGIEINVRFQNDESESISVRELGIYFGIESELSQYFEGERISFNNYKLVSYWSAYDYASTDGNIADEVFIAPSMRPYLIARKVLPQAVTIPAGGVATFKYTIDLSEMQAQENITYSEE